MEFGQLYFCYSNRAFCSNMVMVDKWKDMEEAFQRTLKEVFYWQERCEAAEKLAFYHKIRGGPTRKEVYEIWAQAARAR